MKHVSSKWLDKELVRCKSNLFNQQSSFSEINIFGNKNQEEQKHWVSIYSITLYFSL